MNNDLINRFNLERDIKRELAEIRRIIKSEEADEVKLESIKAIFKELADDLVEAKIGAMMESRTGLLSAAFGEELLEKEIEAVKRYGGKLTIALVDLDFLKYINDHFGHVTGTKAIIEVAGIIKEKVRKSDLVSRYGGDEFLIIFPSTNEKSSEEAVERIREAVAKLRLEGKIKISLSVGAVEYDGNPKNMTAQKLIQEVDKKLYEAKEHRINLNLQD